MSDTTVPDNHSIGIFINANGEQFPVHGLSPLTVEKVREDVEASWKKQGKELPTPPTYTVPASEAHEAETLPHNPTTLEVPGDPEQTKINQAQWREFSLKQAEFDGECSQRLMKKVLLCVQVKPDAAWRDEMEFSGSELPPAGSAAERYSYVENRVIQSTDDLARLMAQVLGLGGFIKKEAVQDAEATFQRMLQQATAEAVDAGTKSEVDQQSLVRGGADSPLLGETPLGNGPVPAGG